MRRRTVFQGVQQEAKLLALLLFVNAQDTTGAGDTFNSAFAVARCEGRSLDDSIRFANAAAALSVQKLGAQGGMPYLKDVERMLGECKK